MNEITDYMTLKNYLENFTQHAPKYDGFVVFHFGQKVFLSKSYNPIQKYFWKKLHFVSDSLKLTEVKIPHTSAKIFRMELKHFCKSVDFKTIPIANVGKNVYNSVIIDIKCFAFGNL